MKIASAVAAAVALPTPISKSASAVFPLMCEPKRPARTRTPEPLFSTIEIHASGFAAVRSRAAARDRALQSAFVASIPRPLIPSRRTP